MICDCIKQGFLSVKQTYVTGGCKTQRAVCIECGKVHTLVTVSVPSRRGRGAYAVAEAIRKKQITAEVILKEVRDAQE